MPAYGVKSVLIYMYGRQHLHHSLPQRGHLDEKYLHWFLCLCMQTMKSEIRTVLQFLPSISEYSVRNIQRLRR